MSIERQVQSVPEKLIKLISMILEGGDQSLSTSQHKISINIALRIHFNSVKRKRSEKVQAKNESPLPVLVGLNFHAKTGKSSLVRV